MQSSGLAIPPSYVNIICIRSLYMIEINFTGELNYFKYEKCGILEVFNNSTDRGHYQVICIVCIKYSSALKIMASE